MSAVRAEAFVIHLARATQDDSGETCRRLPRLRPCRRHSGWQGFCRAGTPIGRSTPLHAPPNPFALNADEIGCFLSHRAVWQTIAASDLDAGLVFEDDVEIDPVMFEPSLDLALAQIHAHGVIQFQVRDIADPGREMA